MSDPREISRVLCVGGTDPTGCAGLFLDHRTLAVFGIHGSGVVTAVTVQNARGVSEVTALSAGTVGAQLDAVLAEGVPACIKTGMLVGEDIVLSLLPRLDRLGAATKLIVDPVLASSSGRRLLDQDGFDTLRRELLPRAALLTPNVPEAELLTGLTIDSVDAMSFAADHLLAMGASAVLIKGGHLPQTTAEGEAHQSVDLLRTLDGDELRLSRPWLSGPGFRGTGCALASAIAAFVAEGYTLASAVAEAGDWLHRVMKASLSEAPVDSAFPLALALGTPVRAAPEI